MPRFEPAEELVEHLTGVNIYDDEGMMFDYDAIEEAVLDKYGCEFDVFASIANDLLLLTYPIESPFGNHYHAFVVPDEKTPGVWNYLMKTKANVVKVDTAAQGE